MITDEPIRALSWKQPYASLMLQGKIETRTWPTQYRGYVLICASKDAYPFETVNNVISGPELTNDIWRNLDYTSFEYLPLGKAIAIGRLIECRPMIADDEMACYVKYKPGLFCHIYRDVQPIQTFDWKGTQGWKILTAQEKELIITIQP